MVDEDEEDIFAEDDERLWFDWDAKKAALNVEKHGVSFDEASTVFGDEREGTMKKSNRHVGPSKLSLKVIPEADFSKEKWKRDGKYARLYAKGVVLPGRGRPKKGTVSGPSVQKTIRIPEAIWRLVETRARQRGCAPNAEVTLALTDWVKR